MSDRVKFFRFQLGADPELFLADIQGNLKASCGKIGGTKEHPQPIDVLGFGYAVQEDNVALEFNIPACQTKRDFVSAISKTMKVLQDGVNSSLGWHLDDRASALFPKEELEHPAAQVFGCDPDFNAWTGQKNPKPQAADETLRSCGGHVHVGFDTNRMDKKRLIKLMDLMLGVPSVLMDKDEKRRGLYGKHGAYRDKPYGVEYRVLSNFWVHNPKLVEWVWDQTARAIDWCVSPWDIDKERDHIAKAIDENDKGLALAICKQWDLEVLHV